MKKKYLRRFMKARMDEEEEEGDEPSEHLVTVVSTTEDAFDRARRQGFDPRTREVWVVNEIDKDFGPLFATIVRELEILGTDPITIMLNTPGGDVNSMFAFYDVVQTTRLHVRCVAFGEVASAGVLMLACCNERLVHENCVLMSHEGADYDHGGKLRYSEVKSRRVWEDWTQNRWFELMARHTTHDAAFWKSITKNKPEYWRCGAEQILEVGIADRMYEGRTW